LRDGEVSQVAVGTEVAEGKRLPPSLFERGVQWIRRLEY
jgi:hypothetical protein